MTTLLKDVLAGVLDETELPELDQSRALEAGRARLKRRRRSIAVGVAAGVLSAAVLIPVGINAIGTGSNEVPPTDPTRVQGEGPFAERKVTYALDSDIHYGEQVISIAPHKVHAFVQTDQGFAFVDGKTVFFTDGGQTKEIGTVEAPYGQLLAADDEGGLVAWVDLSSQGEAVYHAYETATGESQSMSQLHSADGEFEVPSISAVDGSDVYAWGDAGELKWDVASGTTSVVKKDVSNNWLLDVEDGWLAFDDSDPDNGLWGDDLVIAKDAAADAPRYPSGRAELSPGAAYFANDHDDSEQIIRRDGGEVVTPSLDGYAFMGLIQWFDDDRFSAAAYRATDDSKLDLLECSISAGACEVAESGIALKGLQIPVGASIDD